MHRIVQLVHWSRDRTQRGRVDVLGAPARSASSAFPPLRAIDSMAIDWLDLRDALYRHELELGLSDPDPLIHSTRKPVPRPRFLHDIEIATCDHCRRGIPVELSVCPFCGQVVR